MPATPPITLDLIRHGHCADKAWLRGKTDVPLSQQGWQQLQTQLNAHGLAYRYILSSPLQRCQAFAQAFAHQTQTPLTLSPNWQERDYGDWEGCTFKTLQQRHPTELQTYLDDPFTYTPAHAESFNAFQQRIQTTWQQLITSLTPAKAPLLIVTHGGAMRVLLQHLLKLPNDALFQLKIDYATLIRIQYSPDHHFSQLQALYPSPDLSAPSQRKQDDRDL